MLLDTSLTIIPYETCDQYYTMEKTTFWKNGRAEARARFFANLLLWSIRHEIHEMAQVWMGNLETCFSIEVESSFNNKFTGLRVMEALTIQMSISIEERNLTLFEHYDTEMQDIIKVMALALKRSDCFVELFELHQIHFELVKKFNEKHLNRLDKLMRVALRSKNYCACDVIKHSKRSWQLELDDGAQNFWIRHSSKHNQINIDKFISNTERVFPYTLPLSKSGNF